MKTMVSQYSSSPQALTTTPTKLSRSISAIFGGALTEAAAVVGRASRCLVEEVDRIMFRHLIQFGGLLTALPLELPDKGAVEKLPEAQRSLYVEKDGKYRLDVDGVEDTGSLKNSLKAEREEKRKLERQMKDFAKKYEGIDPDAVRELMSHFDSSEEAELLKQGAEGIDKIVAKRTEKMQADYERRIQELEEQMDGALEVAGSYMDRVRDAHVLSAAAKAGVHPGAMEDVLLRAGSIFSVDDDGNAVQFDPEAGDEERVVLGKDQKTPYSPSEWLEEMKENAPHWWPAGASGSGAGGNRGGNAGGAKTIRRAQWEQMPHEERMKKSKEGYQIAD